MIHYQLQCAAGHGFEGWFRDSAAFDEQSGRNLLSCPACGSMEVRRGLMAPAVRTSRKAALPATPQPPEAAPMGAPMGGQTGAQAVALPDQMRAALQRLRADIERSCDDVGDGFAAAARRLHQQETHQKTTHRKRTGDKETGDGGPRRGIYGTVTEPEREALADEGIETMRIPWLPRADG